MFKLFWKLLMSMMFMSITPIQGLKGTGNITAKRIVVDMDEMIHELEPNSSSLLLLLNKMGKKTVDNPEFDWQEDDYVPFYGAINDANIAGDTTFTVVDASVYRVNDLVTAPTIGTEVMMITAVNEATNVITVVRAIGGGSSLAIDGSVTEVTLARIGNAHEEGAGKRTILSTQPVIHDNYCQIVKTTFGATETLKSTKIYGGDELGKDRKKGAVEHEIEIQKNMLFGKKAKITTGTHPKRFMGGIFNRITTNVKDMASAALTEAEWENWMEMLFQYGSDVKYVFCSSKVISYISTWARGKLQTVSKDDTYGISIKEYLSPHGTVYLLNFRKVFDKAPWNTYALGLDLPNLQYVTLQNRGTKLHTNIQANDVDSEEDQIITECSNKLLLEETHSTLINVG